MEQREEIRQRLQNINEEYGITAYLDYWKAEEGEDFDLAYEIGCFIACSYEGLDAYIAEEIAKYEWSYDGETISMKERA